MKSVWKIILCSLAAVALIGTLVWALLFGFELPVVHLKADLDDSNSITMDTSGEISLSDDIHTLDVDWSSGSINIASYDGSEILLRETAQDKEANRLRYRVENGTLHIWMHKPALVEFSSYGKALEILLPSKLANALTAIELEIASAETTLNALSAARLEVNTASGDVTAIGCSFTSVEYDGASSVCRMEDCAIVNFDMDSASGDANLTGSVERISFEAASGNLNVATSVAPSEIEINTASGDAVLTLPADAQFTLECDSFSGKQNISEFVGSFYDDSFVCGNGQAEYEFETASGNLTLHAAK